eukprot:TRINITY_DN729_c0_g1_i1.p1 TRINITY_DN729_c0_g1~~TRINITY_DN729_c0_g1_i1.p1  ORF type:complete len:813 (+),score=227.99 TRINITY_DN729_c0_g1_i1:109-2439(+)
MVALLSAEQVQKLQVAFEKYDVDQSGTLSIVELQQLWREIFPVLTEAEIADETQRIWRDIDIDGDNAVTMRELLQFLDPNREDDIGEALGGFGPRFSRPTTARSLVWAIVDQNAAQEYREAWVGRSALAFGVASQLTILVSIVTMVAESMPEMQSDDGKSSGNTATFAVEATCIAVFTLELALRTLSTPHLRKLVISGWTAIDVLSILPFYLEISGAMSDESAAGSLIVLRVLRTARLVRVLRVLKLGRNSEGIQIMVVALARSRMALTWLVLLLLMAMLLFASLLFHVEKEDAEFRMARYDFSNTSQRLWVRKSSSKLPDAGQVIYFQSIPVAMWWALVTLTTVGYGDSYPVTDVGRVVGSVTMVAGLLVIAFPTTMLCNNFSEACAEFLRKKEQRDRREKLEKRVQKRQMWGEQSAASSIQQRLDASTFSGSTFGPATPGEVGDKGPQCLATDNGGERDGATRQGRSGDNGAASTPVRHPWVGGVAVPLLPLRNDSPSPGVSPTAASDGAAAAGGQGAAPPRPEGQRGSASQSEPPSPPPSSRGSQRSAASAPAEGGSVPSPPLSDQRLLGQRQPTRPPEHSEPGARRMKPEVAPLRCAALGLPYELPPNAEEHRPKEGALPPRPPPPPPPPPQQLELADTPQCAPAHPGVPAAACDAHQPRQQGCWSPPFPSGGQATPPSAPAGGAQELRISAGEASEITAAVTLAMQAALKRSDQKAARLSERVSGLERVVNEQIPQLRSEVAELRHLLKALWHRNPALASPAGGAGKFGGR